MRSTAFVLLVALVCSAASAAERHAEPIVKQILANVAFLRYVAKQPFLPGGAKGTAVMVNGGKVVPGYTEHFVCVDQDAVAGAAP